MPTDWRQFQTDNFDAPAVVDPRRRMAIFLMGFLLLALVVFGRTVQLEVTQGPAFRRLAARPIEKKIALPAPRGRIVDRRGMVLACDRTVEAVAVHYRWLEQPPNPRWLRNMVRSRLSKADRKNPERVAAERARLLAERDETARRLARLCGISFDQWTRRTQAIQARVERIADRANRRRDPSPDRDERDVSWALRMRRLLLDDPPPPRIVVAEELDYHVVADDVSRAVVSEIRSHADRFPGAKTVELVRRAYPGGTLAAPLLGHLGPGDDDKQVGRMGVERQFQSRLQGRDGQRIERTDRSGRMLGAEDVRQPTPGQDVRLSIDAELQRSAEELLADGLRRRAIGSDASSSGGAIVVMDVHGGSLLASASAPTFDPNWFSGGCSEQVASVLADRSHPLLNRAVQMAIPPGSTFKIVTAVALLESPGFDPQKSFFCQGFLSRPDRQRCEIFVREGIGHGDVTLADALCTSCNVYFFHFADRLGPEPLTACAARFGFGRPTGVDLPGEASGTLPSPDNIAKLEGHAWRKSDTQSLAIGQGSLTVTPMQMACMMASVANGGDRVVPHVTDEGRGARDGGRNDTGSMRVLRDGLRRVVSDPRGTAHATVDLSSTAIAAKTGTAETGEGRPSHAWFVGYAPADDPKLVFVVVLENAGDAATAAGPIAKRLVVRMEQLGLL
ncbi:MAG: penicillin-binding transpeptidase domain-containing protein [Thermoguttaceae bacterium]